jgi:hypothetical protein
MTPSALVGSGFALASNRGEATALVTGSEGSAVGDGCSRWGPCWGLGGGHEHAGSRIREGVITLVTRGEVGLGPNVTPPLYGGRMSYEQAFDKSIDTERLFVLQCGSSEHVFEEGDAMSVALELEYEAFHPRLQVVPDIPGRTGPSARVQRRRVILGVVVVVLLVLLMLPITALGGRTIAAGSAPVAGQEYVVRSGDTLASIAERVGGGNVAGLERQLAAEAGSSVVVPGEHLLIP